MNKPIYLYICFGLWIPYYNIHKSQPLILAQDTKNRHVSVQPHRSPTIPNAMAMLMRLCLITWTLSWPVTGEVSPEKAVNKTQLKRQRLGFFWKTVKGEAVLKRSLQGWARILVIDWLIYFPKKNWTANTWKDAIWSCRGIHGYLTFPFYNRERFWSYSD